MLNWENIDTVLLDMDGTLLDLYFDNYFWRSHVPQRYAEKHQLHVDEAKSELFPLFQSVEGTMNWYSVDYWSETLDLDIAVLKREIDHLIAIHPNVIDFLLRLQELGKHSVLVTNAHQKSLSLKLEKTNIDEHLNQVICAHDLGLPKEDPEFWHRLNDHVEFEKHNSLLVDDSLPVLNSARTYGIEYLLAVYKPDSKDGKREVGDYLAIHGFDDIMP